MSAKRIQSTRNYRLFTRSDNNRRTDMQKRKKLIESMKEYGFLWFFPLVCIRLANGLLDVRDGQHRLVIAEMLGIPVHWVEADVEFDIAKVNATPKPWALRDFAEVYAQKGLEAYAEVIEFSDRHSIPVGVSIALLAGTISQGNVMREFKAGVYEIKDREWANAVAAIYAPITRMSKEVKNKAFIDACMAVCRVSGFDKDRLIKNANKCRDKLAPYSTRDSYLEMLEDIYNFHHAKMVGLKVEATMAMRARSPMRKSLDHSEAPVA